METLLRYGNGMREDKSASTGHGRRRALTALQKSPTLEQLAAVRSLRCAGQSRPANRTNWARQHPPPGAGPTFLPTAVHEQIDAQGRIRITR